MNPCRCGRGNDPGFACRRGANLRCIADYQSRLSGPLLDRIDLHIEVPAVTAADLILPPPAEGSAEVAARVARRPRHAGGPLCRLRPANPHQCAGAWPAARGYRAPEGPALQLLRDAADAMRLSARGYHRVLRVGRTLGDLDGADKVGRVHLAEALSYRSSMDEVRYAA